VNTLSLATTYSAQNLALYLINISRCIFSYLYLTAVIIASSIVHSKSNDCN